MSGILVIAEQRRGELRGVSLELVTAAQAVRRGGDAVSVAILAVEPEQFVPALSVGGVDELITVKVDAREFDPDVHQATVASLVAAR
ncbi:MAG TPA: hypothetical protein VN787_06085, partial [Steroidobacteraceae bacterium]|nr:hypothetical protein [Steroidobacteraceae bacterium]